MLAWRKLHHDISVRSYWFGTLRTILLIIQQLGENNITISLFVAIGLLYELYIFSNST